MMANSNAWRGSTVCLGSSFWISGSIKLVMNTSPIKVSTFCQSHNFLLSLLAYRKKFYCFFPELFCYEKDVSVKGDVSRTDECIFHHLPNSAVDSLSFMMCGFLQFRIRRPSSPMLKEIRETVLRPASDHGLSPHIIPFSISRWHLFCLLLGLRALLFIFCWALRALLFFSDCAKEPIFISSYMGSC